jgi:hypothetical protein
MIEALTAIDGLEGVSSEMKAINKAAIKMAYSISHDLVDDKTVAEAAELIPDVGSLCSRAEIAAQLGRLLLDISNGKPPKWDRDGGVILTMDDFEYVLDECKRPPVWFRIMYAAAFIALLAV